MLRSQFFIYSLFIFVFLSSLRHFCFWAYLWQLKEYRWSRMKEELLRNHRIIPWKIIAVATFIFSLAFGAPYFFNILAPVYFFLGGLYSIFRAAQTKWALPKKFTMKIILILWLSVVGWGALFLLDYSSWLMAILAVDILMPLWVAVAVGLVEIPVSIIKRYVIKQAKKKREEQKNLTVIGITGSYGKTSVKKFLDILLQYQSGQDKILTTSGHVNTEIGIAQTILKDLKPTHRFFICEMGAYRRGEIRKDSQIIQPKIGILTGINEQHLALFGSLKNTIQAKTELIQALPPDGVGIFNGDNQYVKKIYQTSQKTKRYATVKSSDRSADLQAEDIKISKEHLFFKITDGKLSLSLHLPLAGKENIINILLASLAARELGLSLPNIQKCLQSYNFTAFQKIHHQHGLDIINATYSTNPNSFLADLEHLKLWSGKKIVVTPGIIELGSAAHRLHQEIGEKLAETADLIIFTRNYYLESVRTGIEKRQLAQKQSSKAQLIYLSRPSAIVQKVKQYTQPEDAVLLEGRLPRSIIENL